MGAGGVRAQGKPRGANRVRAPGQLVDVHIQRRQRGGFDPRQAIHWRGVGNHRLRQRRRVSILGTWQTQATEVHPDRLASGVRDLHLPRHVALFYVNMPAGTAVTDARIQIVQLQPHAGEPVSPHLQLPQRAGKLPRLGRTGRL